MTLPTRRGRNWASKRDDLGGGRCVARVDRALRGAAGAVRGWEEPVQAPGHAERAAARRRADHAVWAHVREVGDRRDCGELAASQGARGPDSRDTPGPAGEATAAEGRQPPRTA